MSETPILNRDEADHDPAIVPEHDPFGAAPPERPNQPGGPHDPPSGSRARAWIAGGVAAAVLATGGFFGVEAVASHTKSVASASAGPGGGGGFGGPGFGRGGGGVAGTIKSINGTSLVVTTTAGATETVTTTPATTATQAVTATLSDVKTGDHVVVMGTGTTTVAATSITDSGANAAAVGGGGAAGTAGTQGGPPGAAAGGTAGGTGAPPGGGPQGGGFGLVSGTVADVGSGRLTVTETDGTKLNVTVSSSTTVMTLQTISVSDLAVGQPVTIRGTTTNGTVAATAIEEGTQSFGQGGPGGPGAQAATNGA